MKRIFHIVLLLFTPFAMLAQPYYLKGQVQDDKGNMLQNVSIQISSTGYVYYSGLSGTFGIVTTRKMDTLTFFLDGYERKKLPADATTFNIITLKKLPQVKSTPSSRLSSLTQNLKREVQQQWFVGEETYASIIENQFINVAAYPATDITLNIDCASYSNIRRFLNMGSVVPSDAVRIEEMLNYFNFSYIEPPDHQTFSIRSTLTACPWNAANYLLFTHIHSKKIPLEGLPPSHLVFLIDVSGSMDMPNRLPLLKSGFRGLINNLRPIDSVSVVVYGGTIGIMLNTTSGAEKEKIFKAIDSLQPGGSTPGESGIKLAYSVARNHFIKGGNNRVILATDGDFNVGLRTDEELEEMIITQRHMGIYLTCLGVGMGNYKDSKIQVLAQKGNGNFAYIDSYTEAERVLVKEFTQTFYTVADDAYLNAQFNPEYVKMYRLIGFDNKVGAIKDTTATIEGGEIGSAHSMIIAFEIVPTEKALESVKNKLPLMPASFQLHYKIPGSTVQCRLKENAQLTFVPSDQLNRCYRFATAVVAFGLLLRNSKFIKGYSWNEVAALAAASADKEHPSQTEFLTLVQQAKNIYKKKRRAKEY
ncbi:MAG: von Willebrand factor type A domain-containing protein [Flavisolibacter sp.]|nr:von Willebrand factor type A domain-containing protein [Flavisolibacter sp.]